MVTVYGMNPKIGNVSFYDPTQEQTFTKPYSEETGKIIDEEVRLIISEAYKRTLALLTGRKIELEKLAKALLEREVLFQSDVEALIGERPYEEKKPVHVVDDTHGESHHAKSAEEVGNPEGEATIDSKDIKPLTGGENGNGSHGSNVNDLLNQPPQYSK
jgi:cell division protease FtsH